MNNVRLNLPCYATYYGRSRPPSDRIPSAVQSDSVRRPIGLRPPSDHQHTLTKVVKIMTNAPFPHRIPLKT